MENSEENKVQSDDLKRKFPANVTVGGEVVNEGTISVDGQQLPQTEPTQPDRHPITPQEFIERYNALCEESGYQLITNPAFIKRDDGTYSIVIQAGVGEMPKQQG